MVVERSIEIQRPVEEVFDFVADPGNDPHWCPKVLVVKPLEPGPPQPGARFEVVHRPVPLRPSRTMDYSLVASEAPARLVWREDDGHDEITVTYLLEPVAGGTRMTQRDEIARLGAPRLLRPLIRAGIGADLAKQLRRLKRQLERGGS